MLPIKNASGREFKAIIARMLRWIAGLMIFCTGTVYGAVKHVPIRSGVVLKPGEAYTAQVQSDKQVEIGWTAVQAKPCTMDCIRMTLVGENAAGVLCRAVGGGQVHAYGWKSRGGV